MNYLKIKTMIELLWNILKNMGNVLNVLLRKFNIILKKEEDMKNKINWLEQRVGTNKDKAKDYFTKGEIAFVNSLLSAQYEKAYQDVAKRFRLREQVLLDKQREDLINGVEELKGKVYKVIRQKGIKSV